MSNFILHCFYLHLDSGFLPLLSLIFLYIFLPVSCFDFMAFPSTPFSFLFPPSPVNFLYSSLIISFGSFSLRFSLSLSLPSSLSQLQDVGNVCYKGSTLDMHPACSPPVSPPRPTSLNYAVLRTGAWGVRCVVRGERIARGREGRDREG